MKKMLYKGVPVLKLLKLSLYLNLQVHVLYNFIHQSIAYCSAHDILIFEQFLVVFVVRTIISNWMFYSSKCGIHLTWTVIAQWS